MYDDNIIRFNPKKTALEKQQKQFERAFKNDQSEGRRVDVTRALEILHEEMGRQGKKNIISSSEHILYYVSVATGFLTLLALLALVAALGDIHA